MRKTETQKNRKHIFRSCFVAAVMLILVSGSAQAAVELLDSGTTGGLKFEVTFDDASMEYTTLTVTGSGPMPDYTPKVTGSTAPWHHSPEEVAGNFYRIMQLKLGSGITHIGDYAFNASAVSGILILYEEVEIPSSVTSIGKYAFWGNEFSHGVGEGKIIIPDSVKQIGEKAIEPTVTIVCSEGSAAWQYALSNGNRKMTFAQAAQAAAEQAAMEAQNSSGSSSGNGGTEGSTAEKETEKADSVPVKENPAPQQYTCSYVLNGGTNHKDNPAQYQGGSTITLKNPVRKGYAFAGWYADPGFGKRVETVRDGNVSAVYAKWTKVKVGKPAAPKLSGASKGKLKITIAKVSKAKGYQIQYSTKKNFKKSVKVKKTAKRSLKIRVTSGKTWYARVRAWKTDSAGKPVYGKWSKPAKCRVK